MERIVFYGAKSYDRESFDKVNGKFGFELKYFKAHPTLDNVSLTQGATAVCVFVNDPVTADIIHAMAGYGVKLIALRCAGYNNVDLQAAAEVGIRVVRVPAYSPHAIAEFALALMLAADRHIPRAVTRTRDGNFSLQGLLGFDLYGKTLGVIGTGKIAKVLVRMLSGFGMTILGYDPYPDEEFALVNAMQYVTLDELFQRSDVITLHCPLTPETRYVINAESIAKMKDGVMIVNTGRGQLIDTNALIEGLKSRKIGSAALDVYEEEGNYFYEDTSDAVMVDDTLARLLSFNNVYVTSHQAFFTREALHNIANTTLQNVKDFVDGKSLINEVKATE
ncbi:MAG: 2-hydroxyacid dehydrogenase [Bacteroidales bacterium]|nr:2-hydroxyacid dehydrogenase [Bacteroidales bacterium]